MNQVITTTDSVNTSHGHGAELKQPDAEECTHNYPSHAKLVQTVQTDTLSQYSGDPGERWGDWSMHKGTSGFGCGLFLYVSDDYTVIFP